MNNNEQLKKICGIAVFSALAYAATLVFHIPVSFLTFDAKDAVLVIASFIYGPISAVIMPLIVSLIELITISGTGLWGFLMNFCSSCAFALTASLIYKFRRTTGGALLSLYTATIVTTAVMIGMNILVTPIYMGVDRAVVIRLLPKLLAPFNFAKGLMNSAIAMILYKPIVTAMRRAKLLSTKMETRFNKNSVIMLVVGIVTLACAITAFVILRLKNPS